MVVGGKDGNLEIPTMGESVARHVDEIRDAFGKEVTDLVFTFRVRLDYADMAEVLQQIAEELKTAAQT